MSWLTQDSLTFVQRFCIKLVKCGPIPKHIALIMDGNRRYARKNNLEKRLGHTKGFERLSETLLWCREIGIKEVTVYAFSIENFKRSAEEVETLMELSREKIKKLIEEKEEIMAAGVCVRVIGNLSLLPDDIKKLVAEVILMTKDNDKAFLNIAFAYTSRDEITNAIKLVNKGVRTGQIEKEDISEELLSKCMYTSKSTDPDLYIRTSGEVRFSDFLLWQNTKSVICFTKVLWPEYNIWHLLGAIFHYQRYCIYTCDDKCNEENLRVKEFLESVERERLSHLEAYAALPISI